MSEPEVISLDDSEVAAEGGDDDDDLPDAKTCQQRTEEFAAITGTDEACAQFYLQDRKWNVAASVNAFFDAQSTGGVKVLNDGDEPELIITFDKQMTSQLASGSMTTEPPKSFRFVTWNIDGLDDHNLKKRTKAVVKILEIEKADIVFLQEVIPSTFSYLKEHLPQFHFVAGGDEDYFTATMLRRTTVYYDKHTLIPFSNTCMGRNLLCVQAHIGKLKLNLLNTHLESTVEFSKQRTEQMKICFDKLKLPDSDVTTIFAGDLNARDKEVDATRIPNVFDMWEACGKRMECKWTWDTQRNTNKQFPGKYKPKTRFDRIYFKQASPPMVTPKHFGLIGIQKVSGTQSFPSDHWGLIGHFQIFI